MKLKVVFEFTDLGDEIVAVPTEEYTDMFQGAITINATAKRILECLFEETTVEEIVEKLSAEYSAPAEEIKLAVESYIAELDENHLIMQ